MWEISGNSRKDVSGDDQSINSYCKNAEDKYVDLTLPMLRLLLSKAQGRKDC